MSASVRQALGGLAPIAIIFALVFGPAGTLQYWQGWVYLCIALGGGAAMVLYLRRSDPELLKRRSRLPTAEKATSQKLIQFAVLIVFVGTLVIASLDRRFAWSHVPLPAMIAGYALFGGAFRLIFLAFRANTFAGVTIDVETDQKVISTGPYAIVRHPYYSGLLLWTGATPLVLGSWWALLMVVPMIAILVARIRYEEGYLTQHLPGYTEYCRSVRSRLIPRVW
jgi:protein-S-isoprenylcysteine O-methyltransferase Ste14